MKITVENLETCGFPATGALACVDGLLSIGQRQLPACCGLMTSGRRGRGALRLRPRVGGAQGVGEGSWYLPWEQRRFRGGRRRRGWPLPDTTGHGRRVGDGVEPRLWHRSPTGATPRHLKRSRRRRGRVAWKGKAGRRAPDDQNCDRLHAAGAPPSVPMQLATRTPPPTVPDRAKSSSEPRRRTRLTDGCYRTAGVTRSPGARVAALRGRRYC